MAARLLVLLLVATPVTAASCKKILRNWVGAGCVVVLVTALLLLIMWKCIGHLKKRVEKQAIRSDPHVLHPGGQSPFHVFAWPSSEALDRPQVYLEVPPPTYSSLVSNKKPSLKHSSQDTEPKVFTITI